MAFSLRAGLGVVIPTSCKSLRFTRSSQSLTCTCGSGAGIWREAGSVHRQQHTPNRAFCGFNGARQHQKKLVGVASSVQTRKGSGSTENGRPSSGESVGSSGKVPSKEAEASSAQELEEQDDLEIQREIEARGSKLKGAKMGIMREALGKGEFEFKPIAILPHQEECQPLTFKLGNTAMDYESILKCKKRPGLGPKVVHTNENLVDEKSDCIVNRSSLLPTDSVSPQMLDMAAFLTEEVGMTKVEVAQFVTSPPSLLGVSVEELRTSKAALEALGLGRKDVACLLTVFPCSVGMDWGNVRDIYLLLCKEVGMSKALVVRLAKKHPFLFTMDCGKVRTCLLNLQSLKIPASEIAIILNHAPLFACTPLTKKTLVILETFRRKYTGWNCLQDLLFQTTFHRPSELKLTNNTAQLTVLLHTYGADPKMVLSKCPLYFEQNGEKLQALVRVLAGSPLYLDHEDIGNLLEKGAAVLCSITDVTKLKKHLNALCKLYKVASFVRIKFKENVKLLDPACEVKAKYRCMTSNGFSHKDAGTILTKVPSVLTQHLEEELLPRMECLKKIGFDSAQLAKAPTTMTVPLNVVMARIKFASEHKPELLEEPSKCDLLLSSHQLFAEKCGKSLAVYLKETKLKSNSRITKRGKSRTDCPTSLRFPSSLLTKNQSSPSVSQGEETGVVPVLEVAREHILEEQTVPLLEGAGAVMEEVPAEEGENQVLDSGVLLGEGVISPQDAESASSPAELEDSVLQGDDLLEGVSLERYIMKELEGLVKDKGSLLGYQRTSVDSFIEEEWLECPPDVCEVEDSICSVMHM